MKHFTIFIILVFFACNQPKVDKQVLQKQIDSLKTRLNTVYKPGFGFLMTNIQAHHAKLWFAGINKNWKLAKFEIKELKEIVEEIETYQKNRKETKLMNMIEPELEAISKAIEQKNPELFKEKYNKLTLSCNKCHKLTDFEYNIAKVPETNEFSNQEFNIK